MLVKVAHALQIRLEELIEPPRRAGRLYPASSLPFRKRGSVTVRKLLPETLAGLEIERMELPTGAAMAGVPHTPGTREYLTCEQGQIERLPDVDRTALAVVVRLELPQFRTDLGTIFDGFRRVGFGC